MTTDPLPLIPPTPGQLAWQRQEFGVFFHFGVNTFAGLEWSDGTLDPSIFNPTRLDADQWVATAADAGARYVILTAKHHDGFCLWPTDTTDYSVRSSPWKDGTGDVVAEVMTAADKYGLGFGLYLSPWDRHAPCYPDPVAYDRYYQDQLRELCTRYGTLSELWFDGAGSQGREYDWVGIGEVINQTQPQAMIFNMGDPTIRWVGNEDGLASDPVDYVVTETDFSQYTVQTTRLDRALYLPPECDVSIRKGWFWAEDDRPKTLDHLLAVHYRSIGMGANLLLNLPPDNRGLIPEEDVDRLAEWRAELDRRFANGVAPAALAEVSPGVWRASFEHHVRLDHLQLVEDFADSQRIRSHAITSGDRLVASGQTVGNKRIHVFEEIETAELTITVDGPAPKLESIRGFRTGVESIPDIDYLAGTEAPAD
ncbi:alpha-L-fucosidase [Microlunatus sp. Gsoil 973]|uniref:alpha-L-fucosidase n=1 Tax=Microlunatus sp. Gsoil 973 TaxID=2672569 RepID=UPI0018A872A9|nr:alpha-L-fucosidase [Microlunatus sp. Gsoil 973]